MKTTYQSILSRIAILQKEADAAKQREIPAVLDRIRTAMDFYGITPADLVGTQRTAQADPATPSTAVKTRRKASRETKRNATKKRTAKFSDGNGNSWGGRGPRPAWLREAIDAGRSIDEFKV